MTAAQTEAQLAQASARLQQLAFQDAKLAEVQVRKVSGRLDRGSDIRCTGAAIAFDSRFLNLLTPEYVNCTVNNLSM